MKSLLKKLPPQSHRQKSNERQRPKPHKRKRRRKSSSNSEYDERGASSLLVTRKRGLPEVRKNMNLIVECEDFGSDKSGNKDAKYHYLKDYWIPAANNLKSYGTWQLLEVRDIDQLERGIRKVI